VVALNVVVRDILFHRLRVGGIRPFQPVDVAGVELVDVAIGVSCAGTASDMVAARQGRTFGQYL
jgi:hypothetical protein